MPRRRRRRSPALREDEHHFRRHVAPAIRARVQAGQPSFCPSVVPLALIGAGQSMLFTGLFRITLADVPSHHAGIGGGTLITLQQSGLALGVATLGTLYLALEPHGVSHAFAAAIGIQLAIVLLLILAARALPSLTPAGNVEAIVADA
jgi:hypothetical protein